MKLINKIKWVLIISVVFLLILSTNLIDQRSSRNISNSIVSIYEDRLVVKNIILDISTVINKKEVAFLTQDTASILSRNKIYTDSLNSDLKKFEQTKLTKKEEESLNLLRQNLALMIKAEGELVQNQFTDFDNYKKVINQVNDNLDILAHIQMQEGRKHMINSKENMMTMELFTQIEIYLLIVLAVIALVIVLYKPKV